MSCASSSVSEIQLEANRNNAKRSTGPRSQEGKTKSSRNAMKFGIFSDQVLLPGEDQSVYESFRDGMYRRLGPRDELERMLADRVVLAAWKLRRVQAAEAAQHGEYRREYARSGVSNVKPSVVVCHHLDTFEYYAKAEAALERSMYRAIAELRKAQAERGEDYVEDAGDGEAVAGKNEPISESAPIANVEEASVAPAPLEAATGEEVICKNEPISPVTSGPACASGPAARDAVRGDDPRGG